MAKTNGVAEQYHIVVIGAGFGGMYALHHLRSMGLSVRVYEGAVGVGGTWWWNRYPGARVDFPGGPFYCYTFSDELFREYDWPETQPDQPAVLAYLEHVADRFDLRRDIQLETWVTGAKYDERSQRWTIETNRGEHVSTSFWSAQWARYQQSTSPISPVSMTSRVRAITPRDGRKKAFPLRANALA